MRILVALDEQSYSGGIIKVVATLAMNTWADITLLGLQTGVRRSEEAMGEAHPLVKTMGDYTKRFFGLLDDPLSPYKKEAKPALVEKENGVWEMMGTTPDSRKELKIRFRLGHPDKDILTEAAGEESDLLVLGCSGGEDCQWQGEMNLPEKIAKEADCTVLVIKEDKIPEKIICCLDQASVSQSSLEMINQVVTLHDADLEINGLTGPKGLKEEVERKMDEIVRYYTARKITAWVKLVDIAALGEYVAQASREGLIALWMGKKSLLEKIFNRDVVGKLVSHAQSSVLILR